MRWPLAFSTLFGKGHFLHHVRRPLRTVGITQDITGRKQAKVTQRLLAEVREEIFNLRAKLLSNMGFMELLQRYIDKYLSLEPK